MDSRQYNLAVKYRFFKYRKARLVDGSLGGRKILGVGEKIPE
jgi:hypothetical protein